MTGTKILMVSPEMAPFTELTEQSNFLRDLAVNLQKKGAEIRIFIPKFGGIKERKHRLHEVIRLSGLNITIGRNNNPLIIKVASLQSAKIQVYFLDNEDYFSRKGYYTDEEGNYYPDNDERIIFYNKAILELLFKLGWTPDFVHCQGWQSGLIPIYAKTLFKNEPPFRKVKIIQIVNEDGFIQSFGNEFLRKAHLKIQPDMNMEYMENPSSYDLNKVGMLFADHFFISSKIADPKIYQNNLSNAEADATKEPIEEFYEKYFKILNL
jgi:starch synthase